VALGTDNLMLAPPSVLKEMRTLYLAARLDGGKLTYREILEIGVDNPRLITGMGEWRPEEGSRWNGILIPYRHGGPWQAAFR
jgi:cytosine/adenosine deaminase-related metal-dependent hydrolase